VKISCKEDHICRTNFAKKWNEICMKQLASGKCMENNCFPRTLKFKMICCRRYVLKEDGLLLNTSIFSIKEMVSCGILSCL
jgi:hypothetical protein